jgi:hypothetical protein
MPAAPVIAAELRDPRTLDVGSVLRGQDVIDDQVMIALRARRGSGAALGSTGQRFSDIRKLSTNVKRLLEVEARTALATLVARGDITIRTIEPLTDDGQQWSALRIEYVNERAIGRKDRNPVIPLESSTL